MDSSTKERNIVKIKKKVTNHKSLLCQVCQGLGVGLVPPLAPSCGLGA
jgi:hypothetical protein